MVNRLARGTLTVAVIMDSMDWFDPGAGEAGVQIANLNRAMRLGGRVLLRSAALMPWYIDTFEGLGFVGRRVGARVAGACIDRYVPPPFFTSESADEIRVNMYASCYVLTKIENLAPVKAAERGNEVDLEELEI